MLSTLIMYTNPTNNTVALLPAHINCISPSVDNAFNALGGIALPLYIAFLTKEKEIICH